MTDIKELTVEKLKVKVYDSRSAMGKYAAAEVAEKLRELLLQQDTVNMIFAAAPSQNEFLAALSVAEGIDWTRVNAFHMDEYIGLHENASQHFGVFLKERLFEKVPFNQVFYINGNAVDPEKECGRYSKLLIQYPVDIVCMGIGENTHIAFNDPHIADFDDPERVKIVYLSDASRHQQVHDGCFETIEDVPLAAITLTIPALLSAGYICCVVPGPTKSQAVYHTLNSEISPRYPSTSLRKHDNATLYLDKYSAGFQGSDIRSAGMA